jgi:hypothetical protein
MRSNKKMSYRNQKTAPNFISSGQYKPIYQAGTTQNNKEHKGNYIDHPEL